MLPQTITVLDQPQRGGRPDHGHLLGGGLQPRGARRRAGRRHRDPGRHRHADRHGNTAAATFGAAQARIEAQNAFLSKQADSLKNGVGALVDADMEEASARLAALQTQQQLGIQALSIANQAPQNVLALFR